MAAKRVKELTVVTPNKKGMLYQVASTVAKSGANIMAISGIGVGGGKAKFMLITNNNAKAAKALKARKFKVKENAVAAVSLANKVGAASRIGQKLAKAGINLDYCYGSTSGKGNALLVFSTKNLAKALKVC